MLVESALLSPGVQRIVDLALEEDLGRGDVTTLAVVNPGTEAEAEIVAREPLVVAGLAVAALVFRRVGLDPGPRATVDDGASVAAGASIMRLRGSAASLLAGERVALNFLQRLSGIATLTRAFVEAARGTRLRITDTRKTTPGLRMLERHAVRAGGGANHRFDLGSGVLIKDNHVALAGSVREAVGRARRAAPHGLGVEVEVDSLAQLEAALAAGADIVLLDNFAPADVAAAVRLADARSPRPLLEVSGGVTLARIPELAHAGVDLVSVGALTHSARAVDLSMEMRPRRPVQP